MGNIQDLYMSNSCLLDKTVYFDRISLSVFHFMYASQSSSLGKKKLPFLNPLGPIRFIIW